jgi:stearoyl-CoA desaturase (delta-9 desaturase)
MVATTLYLHRGLTHRSVQFHPALDRFFRFWLWLTDGVNCKEWVAQHRRHHIHSDKPGDPHSPLIFGIYNIAVKGFFITFYKRYGVFNEPEDLEIFGKGVEPSALETMYLRCGLLFMLGINVALFHWTGVIIWIVQLAWTQLWSNSVITGVSHWKFGYKAAQDNSRNLPGLWFFVIGDNLHSNHHANPSKANLSVKRGEFDLGWYYLRGLEKCGLAKIKH